MKQVWESIFKATIGSLIHYRSNTVNKTSYSYQKNEYNFNGPVYFSDKPKKIQKDKLLLTSKVKQISKF